MRKITLYLIIVFAVRNCGSKELLDSKSYTFVKGIVNQKNMEGDGVTFFRPDSTLHFRGFLGNSGFHYQIDIRLNDHNPGIHLLDSTSIQSAGVAEIVGMDGVAAIYYPQSQFSNFIDINFDPNFEYLSGDLEFHGFSSGYNRSISVVCTFKVKIGEIGQNNWNCDFGRDGISNCRFLK